LENKKVELSISFPPNSFLQFYKLIDPIPCKLNQLKRDKNNAKNKKKKNEKNVLNYVEELFMKYLD